MQLRKKLLNQALCYCQENNMSKRVFNSALVFNSIEDNFYRDSYSAIMNNPEYEIRLKKRHSFFKNEDIKELQSSASSDALLMNIFCHPKIQKDWIGIRKLLEVESIKSIEFGYLPNIESDESMRKTEIDMKIDSILFEAKLTETNFTKKDFSTLIHKYPQTEDIFNIKKLLLADEVVVNYQLIRNILAANERDCRFILLLHSERTDLLRSFYKVFDSIKSEDLKKKVSFLTWQEIASVVGKDLKNFLKSKYAI